MATTMISALTLTPVRRKVAMTGEITLRGNVLPIGGLREKVLAAYRAGFRTLVVPRDNEKDLVDVPRKVLRCIHFIYVETMDEVLKVALVTKLQRQPAAEPVPNRKRSVRKNEKAAIAVRPS
jgi:ATP-dependent Lon protease